MAYEFEWQQKEKQVPMLDESGLPMLLDGKPVMQTRAPIFKGSVIVQIPKHQERLKFLKSLQLSVSSDGVVNQSAVDQTDVMIEFVKKHIKKIDILRESDGYMFDSIDQIEVDADGLEVLTDIGNVLIQGVRLSKK